MEIFSFILCFVSTCCGRRARLEKILLLHFPPLFRAGLPKFFGAGPVFCGSAIVSLCECTEGNRERGRDFLRESPWWATAFSDSLQPSTSCCGRRLVEHRRPPLHFSLLFHPRPARVPPPGRSSFWARRLSLCLCTDRNRACGFVFLRLPPWRRSGLFRRVKPSTACCGRRAGRCLL